MTISHNPQFHIPSQIINSINMASNIIISL